jgi:hypothetical protein
MSDIATQSDRDERGRYKTGNIGGGRPRGARSKLSEAFIADVHTVWEEAGIEALRACAAEKPSEFCRIIGLLMPRDINLSVGLDAASFARTFQDALALLGNEAPRQIRKPLPGQPKVIEHNGR